MPNTDDYYEQAAREMEKYTEEKAANVRMADPELERLLAEEEEIDRRAKEASVAREKRRELRRLLSDLAQDAVIYKHYAALEAIAVVTRFNDEYT